MLRLKDIREEKKLQQKDVAAKLNRTPACISSWENGKTEPSIDDILRLSEILDVTTDYLLGCSDDPESNNRTIELTPIQQNLLSLFNSLTRDNQFRVLGFIQALKL